MPLERDDIEASLRRKGFVEGGSDHRHFTYHTNAGQKTSVWTKTSHGSGYKTLSDHLVQQMARQCGLTRVSSSKFTSTRSPVRSLEHFPYGARGGGLANAMVWSKWSHDGNRRYAVSASSV